MLPLLLVLLQASAQEPPTDTAPSADERARTLFDNGSVLYSEGRYGAAIEAWNEAYSLSGRPLILYNIANAQERSGDLRGAIDTLDRYRALAPAEERDTLARRIAAMEERLAAVERRASLSPGAIAAFSVSGASFAAGTVYGIASVASQRQLEDLCVDGLCPGHARKPLQQQQRRAVTADVLFGVGLVAAGVGVAQVVGSTSVQVGPGGIVWRGSF